MATAEPVPLSPVPGLTRVARAPRARLAVALALGALAALGQAPLGLWPATVLGLALVYGLWRAGPDGAGAAGRLGLAWGMGYFLLALGWIVEPFLVDVARHGWMAPLALLTLCAGMALFPAAGFALARRCGGGAPAWIGALVLAEALRGRALTGFPWAQPGHAWIDTPMLYWSAVLGALGLTAAMLVAAVALWHVLAGRRMAGALGLAAVAALYGAGVTLTPAPAAPRPEAALVRLVQPNASQREKWLPEKRLMFFERQLRFTAADGAGRRPDLVVWPETSLPVPLNHAGPEFARIAEAAAGAPVVAGVLRYDGPRLFNSLAVVAPDGRLDGLYDKHHLVPFGEYVPAGDLLGRLGISGLATRDGHGFSPGPGPELLDLGALGRALPLICYEGVFARQVNAAPGRADLLLLVTNDAWFGRISGPYQHLAQARLRSAEQGLPMIRVANTGVSAVIDAWGRVTARIPLGQAGWLDAALPPARAPTPYAGWGDIPAHAIAAALLGLGLLRHRRAGADV